MALTFGPFASSPPAARSTRRITERFLRFSS
jgi:hypothetical protein